MRTWTRTLCSCLALLPIATTAASAAPVTSTELSNYLLIGIGEGSEGTQISLSNYEVGANNATVPMPGLTLVAEIPDDTLPVATGNSNDANMAITDPTGIFNFSDMDIYADATIGVQCAGTTENCDNGKSNTDFNGSTFNSSNGLSGGVDFTDLNDEISWAMMEIPTLVGDDNYVLDLSSDGKFVPNTVIDLISGLTVIDIDTGGADLLLENTNLVFDGPADAFAIVRIPDGVDFNVSQSAILVGDSGIGLTNVLFYTDSDDSDQHYNFNSLLVNGVSFWDLSKNSAGATIGGNNIQGCTQFLGSEINLQNTRLSRCAFLVPEPQSFSLVALGLVGLAAAASAARRQRRPARARSRRSPA